jgi:uncharacterized membrane protein YfcA
MLEFSLFLLTGAVTGIISGLLGVGGGMIIVPILLVLLSQHHVPTQLLMHVALGTSLATIIFTSFSSARAHHGHRRINWPIVWHLSPGIIFGTLLGAWLAARLNTDHLKILFVIFMFYVGTQMLMDFCPPPTRELPEKLKLWAAGGLIGAISSLVGIGGGSMTVPFLVCCRCHMREAVGTSSAVGLPIAVAGTIGYVLTGLHVDGRPPYSLGFVYLPAAAGITAASMLTAPIGAKLAQKLPVPLLKKGFAVLLYGLALNMLSGM